MDAQASNSSSVQKWNTNLLALVLIYSTFSGALRKWFLTGGLWGNLILMGQLVLPFVLLLLMQNIKLKAGTGYFLVVYILLLTLQAVNPMNQTLFHGILGIILHLGFWLITFAYFDNAEKFAVHRLVPLLFLLVAVQIGLSVVQYQLPPSHWLNKYATDQVKQIAMVGNAVRVTGTFSYLGGYTAFVTSMAFWAWGIYKLNYSKKIKYSLIAAVIIAGILSGSRGTLLICGLIVSLGLISEFGIKRFFVFFSNTFILGALLSILFFRSAFIQGAYDNIQQRFEYGFRTNEYENRTLGLVREVIDFRGDFPFLGIGLGATYQGANAIWGESKYARNYPGGYEEEAERIVLEGGYLLFFFKVMLFYLLYQKLKIPKLGKLIILPLLFFFFPIVFNVYNAIFLFFGLIVVDYGYSVSRP